MKKYFVLKAQESDFEDKLNNFLPPDAWKAVSKELLYIPSRTNPEMIYIVWECVPSINGNNDVVC